MVPGRDHTDPMPLMFKCLVGRLRSRCLMAVWKSISMAPGFGPTKFVIRSERFDLPPVGRQAGNRHIADLLGKKPTIRSGRGRDRQASKSRGRFVINYRLFVAAVFSAPEGLLMAESVNSEVKVHCCRSPEPKFSNGRYRRIGCTRTPGHRKRPDVPPVVFHQVRSISVFF